MPGLGPKSLQGGEGDGVNTTHQLASSGLCKPLQRMEIRFDGLRSVGGLRTINGARFGMVRNGGSRAHQGVDLFALPGTPVFAIAAGEVVRIRRHDPSYGQEVMVRFRPDRRYLAHVSSEVPPDGILFALYAHLSSVVVRLGAVRLGHVLGFSGVSGNADQRYPHLHFEVRTRADPGLGLRNRIDPEQIFFDVDYSKPVEALDRARRIA
jgi:murein DD-endopeptidase MepM/ murein hydrolase activator NlpD